MRLENKRVLILGGTSGIGFGVAEAALEAGAAVVVASRSHEKIQSAIKRLEGQVSGVSLDITDPEAVETFFANQSAFDHIVVSAAKTKIGPVRELPLPDASASMTSKFWGAYHVARCARINDGGSLTLVSGFLSIRPTKTTALQGAINSALEGLTRGLALELQPTRVNCVSPGLVETEMYSGLGGDARQAMFDGAAGRLPTKMVGAPAHIAVQILAFMCNPYISGSVVYVDGGGSLI